ncbi:MAG TPA: hypothetical protein VNK04_26665 [Gemmataceae bacterium]|nr:hypothetical protein [Gemmataceae bacterium]
MSNLNLYLAVFWLVLGVGLVLFHQMNPDDPTLRLRGTDWSPGWLGIVLAVYNLARWYSLRASLRQQALFQEELRRAREREHHRPPAEPDPNFNFTDMSPPSEERRDG